MFLFTDRLQVFSLQYVHTYVTFYSIQYRYIQYSSLSTVSSLFLVDGYKYNVFLTSKVAGFFSLADLLLWPSPSVITTTVLLASKGGERGKREVINRGIRLVLF
jgi:hypothetical protein